MTLQRRSFPDEVLARVRSMSLDATLRGLDFYVKVDPDFRPVKNATTQRWYVTGDAQTFELLVTGPKWYDPRADVGGGGAIDLAMHLTGQTFVQVVKRLA